jgi:hypothetical protein
MNVSSISDDLSSTKNEFESGLNTVQSDDASTRGMANRGSVQNDPDPEAMSDEQIYLDALLRGTSSSSPYFGDDRSKEVQGGLNSMEHHGDHSDHNDSFIDIRR